MKKHWKIIVGVILIIGGFGNIGSNIIAFIVGIVLGAGLIAWDVLSRQRNTISALDKVTKEVPSNAFHEGPLQTDNIASPNTDTNLPPFIIPKNASKDVDVVIPSRKDGAMLSYQYSVPLVEVNYDVAYKVASEKRWFFSVEMKDGVPHIMSEGAEVGVLNQRVDMVADWIKRGDPYLVILERANATNECLVRLVFYRDKRKQYAYREQSVFSLTGYKSQEKQDNMMYLEEGDELEAEEDAENENRVIILRDSEPIGFLPKKYGNRYLSEGAALIVFDHEDFDDDLKSKPYVRIFW